MPKRRALASTPPATTDHQSMETDVQEPTDFTSTFLREIAGDVSQKIYANLMQLVCLERKSKNPVQLVDDIFDKKIDPYRDARELEQLRALEMGLKNAHFCIDRFLNVIVAGGVITLGSTNAIYTREAWKQRTSDGFQDVPEAEHEEMCCFIARVRTVIQTRLEETQHLVRQLQISVDLDQAISAHRMDTDSISRP